MISIVWIILTLAIVVFLAFKKVNIVAISVLAAVILALLDGQNLLSALTEDFMGAAANYVKSYLLLFSISALFGKFMEVTGAAASIAKFLARLLGPKFAIVGLVLTGAILVYGGISSLVIAFTLSPIALALFQKADLPRRLIPGAIAAGCFTFAASAFPGTPQQMNVIPIAYLGTDVMAAPVLGVICGVIGLGLACVYMFWEGQKARKLGEHFVADESIMQAIEASAREGEDIHPLIAFLPMLVTIVLLIFFHCNVLLAVLIGTALCAVLMYKNLKDIRGCISAAVQNAGMACIFTGSIVGYGAIVKASTGYAVLSQALTSLEASPLLSFSLATTILAGAAGSGSGGLGIALDAMAADYLAQGVPAQVLHRVGALAAIGLDSLPHNGAVITLLTLCGMTHKDSYKQIFVTTVVITCIVFVLAVILGTVMYPIGA